MAMHLIRSLFFSVIVVSSYALQASIRPFVLFLAPAGHATQSGRALRQGYERAATYHWATALKTELESHYACRVIINRSPGEALEEFQTVTYSNRLQPDLFISLSLFPVNAFKPQLFVFNLLVDPLTDAVRRLTALPVFIPYEQAHCARLVQSSTLARQLTARALQPDYEKQCDYRGPYAFPYKPLMGICAPSIGLEAGVLKDNDWQLCMPLLVAAVGKMITARDSAR